MIGLPLLRMASAETVVEVVQAPLLGRGAGGLADVAAHAEGALAGAGEHDHPDGLVVGRRLERLGELGDGLGAEGVQALGPVDGDGGPPAADLVEDVLEGVGHSPPLGS